MSRRHTSTAPKGISSRRSRRPEWVRPFHRAHRALDASIRMIDTARRAVDTSERCAHNGRPVRASRNLTAMTRKLATASLRLVRAANELAVTNACIDREPQCGVDAPELVALAAERWAAVAAWLEHAAQDVVLLQTEVLAGLAAGVLVPEANPHRRPRIVLAPRPAPVRAFLTARTPRATDRISPLLQRRRRTRRPAALTVPRRTSQGRAPPFSPICPL